MRKINITHFSDLHGKIPVLRNEPDFVVLSGDICNNNVKNFTPGIKTGNEFRKTRWGFGDWNFRKIDFEKESQEQTKWAKDKLIPELSQDIPLDRTIILKGNHDFLSFESLFIHALDCGGKTITIDGIKFGLLTGVLPIAGEWNDEINEEEFEKRIKLIDRDIDILISHCPPKGILNFGIGTQEINKAIFGNIGIEPYFTKLKAHLFGHDHENHGVVTHAIDGRIVKFSNAAESRHEISIEI